MEGAVGGRERNVPGFAVKGQPMASCTVRMVLVSRCETR